MDGFHLLRSYTALGNHVTIVYTVANATKDTKRKKGMACQQYTHMVRCGHHIINTGDVCNIRHNYVFFVTCPKGWDVRGFPPSSNFADSLPHTLYYFPTTTTSGPPLSDVKKKKKKNDVLS